MSFKKTNDNSGVACVTVYPKCIVWNLPGIPCLGINTGDTLDELTFAITKKICEISQPLDLSSVSAQCLKDKLGIELPLNKTISTYLQLIIDNQCTLVDLIKAIQDRLDEITNPTLTLNLRCLRLNDNAGNPLSYTVKDILQLLINEVCALRDQITGLNGAIAAINIRIDNLPAPYAEPDIPIPCVYTGQRPLHTGVSLLASDYCAYKAILGTIPEIQTAIGRQCTGLNTQFATNVNFVQDVQNEAQSMNNLWIAFCDFKTRVIALEECACKITCKDITIGFNTVFDSVLQTVTLKFTSGAGTFIPVGFTDCGTTVSISDDYGNTSNLVPITITQEGEVTGLDVSMFEPGSILTFNLDVALCSQALSCHKCVTKLVKNPVGCCVLTASEAVTITYQVCIPTV